MTALAPVVINVTSRDPSDDLSARALLMAFLRMEKRIMTAIADATAQMQRGQALMDQAAATITDLRGAVTQRDQAIAALTQQLADHGTASDADEKALAQTVTDFTPHVDQLQAALTPAQPA